VLHGQTVPAWLGNKQMAGGEPDVTSDHE